VGEKTRNGRHLKMLKVQSNFHSERVKLLMPLREIPFISSQWGSVACCRVQCSLARAIVYVLVSRAYVDLQC